MSLQDIVNVSITRQTASVSRAGFGILNILGSHKRFNERIRFYSSLSAVGEDFETTDLEYIAAQQIFSQEPRVTSVAVGRRRTQDNTVITVTQADSFNYVVTIDGTEFSYTSAASGDTAAVIAAALVLAINGGTEPVTATDNLDGTFDLDPDVASAPYSLTLSDNLTAAAFTNPDTMAEDLQAVKDENDTWYGLMLTSHVAQDVLDAAAWIETERKIFGTSSNDSDIKDVAPASDTTTIAAQLKALNYARTFGFYSANADTQYPEAGAFGKFLPQDPGSYTVKFKTMSAVSVDDLTDTQSGNVKGKNFNTYEEVGGVNIIAEGIVCENEFIDVIVFVDWLQARMTERIYSLLVNSQKVPYTDAGITAVESEVKAQLSQGITVGGLAADPAPVTSVPRVADIDSTDRANRFLPDVEFTATLAGAIHSLEVQGVVSV